MDFVGQTVSNDTQASRNSGNATLFDSIGGDSPFDVTIMETMTGGSFDNWEKFFSSDFAAKGDRFTNLARNNISDAMFTGGGMSTIFVAVRTLRSSRGRNHCERLWEQNPNCSTAF